MASLVAELDVTTADQFAEGSKEFITQLAGTPQKAARTSLAVATRDKEMESLRRAANVQGYTLYKIRNSAETVSEDGQTVTIDLKLGPKVESTKDPAEKAKGQKGANTPAEPSPTAP